MKIDDITIPIFDGSDYSNWKRRILKFSEFKKCIDVVLTEKTEEEQSEKLKTADIKATNYIYSAITNKQPEYICDLNSSFKIMKKIL